VLIPDGDDIGLPPSLAGEGGVGEDLPGVPVDDVESLDLARVPEIVGHRPVHAQVRVLGRHLQYLAYMRRRPVASTLGSPGFGSRRPPALGPVG
jgi:hypothetical protein